MVKPDIPQRYIKKNHKSTLPGRILYLDVETRTRVIDSEQQHRMRLGWTCYVEEKPSKKESTECWREWFDIKALCDYINSLCRDKSPLFMFGHNVYFDLQSSDFFYYFPRFHWKLDFIYDKGMSFILCIRKGKQHLKILSSTNYFPCSLAKLGEIVGIEKGDPDFDNATDEELSPYCKNDVLILKKSMEYYFDFITDNDLGKFAMTKSSQAFNAFRHRFMTHKIGVHENQDIINLERAAYHGGRTECFRFGYMPPVAYCTLDVNSMYPYVMSNFEMPVRCIDYLSNPSMETLKWTSKKFCVIGECFLDTNEPAYAVKHEGKVIFPVGRFKAFLCTDGIKHALENGHIEQVTKLAVYEKAILFKSYVDCIYSLKKEYDNQGSAVMSLLCKYLLNSLYGKFGQRVPVEEREDSFTGKSYYRMETDDLVTGQTFMEYKLFNTVVRQIGLKEGKNTFVAIPGHITEYARFLLWELIKKAGEKNIYYCDTDSIKIPVYKTKPLLNSIDNDRLGALKIEETFAPFVINGNKNYLCGDNRRTKGVPRTAEQMDTVTWKYPTFLRSPTHQQKEVDRWFVVRDTVKEAPPFYDKGVVSSGGIITPFTFREF